jgi:hypothetical protein
MAGVIWVIERCARRSRVLDRLVKGDSIGLTCGNGFWCPWQDSNLQPAV